LIYGSNWLPIHRKIILDLLAQFAHLAHHSQDTFHAKHKKIIGMLQTPILRLFQLAFSSYFRNLNDKDNNLSIIDTKLLQYNQCKSNIFLFDCKRNTIAIATIALVSNCNQL